MNGEVKLKAKKYRRHKKIVKWVKIITSILIILLIIAYLVFSLINNSYNFTISLDRNLYYENNVIIYEHPDYKVYRHTLIAEAMEGMDNISEGWIPGDIHAEDENHEGSHNGENYIAYSFYIENMGEDTITYYMYYFIDDVINNLDEAVRVKVYFDDETTVYAKESALGKDEEGTTSFKKGKYAFEQKVENFGPNDKHHYTIVIFLEGDDPECTDNILGGELKSHIEFKSEFIDEKR